jgi:hypothetical protein
VPTPRSSIRAPIGQPHDTSELEQLLLRTPHLSDEHEDADELPGGAGADWSFGEIRQCQFNPAIARADQTPDPSTPRSSRSP